MAGKLYLIPTRLGENPPLEVLPLSIKKVVEELTHFIVENEKTARRFIKIISPKKSQGELTIYKLNKFTKAEEIPAFLSPCDEGISIGLLSEAGCPAIADPGASVVKLAHEKNIRVLPLVGPSSILLALMASGMNGQQFTFHGYLPIDKNERKRKIKQIERNAITNSASQIFIETPYRNNNLFEDLIKILHNQTKLCVAVDITLPTEYIQTKTAAQWQRVSIDLHKRPCIFIISGN